MVFLLCPIRIATVLHCGKHIRGQRHAEFVGKAVGDFSVRQSLHSEGEDFIVEIIGIVIEFLWSCHFVVVLFCYFQFVLYICSVD